jgi:cell division transport system permease protein
MPVPPVTFLNGLPAGVYLLVNEHYAEQWAGDCIRSRLSTFSLCITLLGVSRIIVTFVRVKEIDQVVSKQEGKIRKRRKVSYLPSVISIALVLFMLGLFGIILINGKKLSDHIRENFQLTVFFNKEVSEADALRVQKEIKRKEYTKEAKYVSKDEAAKQFAQEIGQDFVSFLGFNPLLPSVELFVRSSYATADKVKTIDTDLRRYKEVQDVVYQRSILDEINENAKTIGTILVSLSFLFLLIAVTLINNTIRLNLYARRFIIKSMQMVGATHGFIIRPFMIRSLLHGLYGGILACLLLGGVLYVTPVWIEKINLLYDTTEFAILFVVVIIAGIVISMISSMISTNHYLKLKIDDLY